MSSDNNSEREFANLFGSENETSDIDDGRSHSSSLATQPAQYDLHDLFGSDQEEEESDEEMPQRVLSASEEEDVDGAYNGDSSDKNHVTQFTEMPQLPIPTSSDNKFYLTQLPQYLDVETTPFDPEEFQVNTEEHWTEDQRQEHIRQQVENTIRWRRMNGKMVSNANIVEWEDGGVSLMIGNECFDIVTSALANTHLFAHQPDDNFESQTELTDKMTFKPSGLDSDVHRHLTAQIAVSREKKGRTKMCLTEKAPELVKKEMEEQEKEILKTLKILERERHRAEVRNLGIGSRSGRYAFDEYDPEDYEANQDYYDDDFVVKDDEYDEEAEIEREKKLVSIKDMGIQRYEHNSSDEEDEDTEDDDDDDDNDDDEGPVVHSASKDRLFLSDEDEDED